MICTRTLGAFAILAVGATYSDAEADGHSLKFQLITHRIDMKVVDAPDAEDHQLGTGNYKGVAVFEDGRIADKTFVLSFDGPDGYGYSRYTFLDGSSIALRFDTKDENDITLGEYTVLSGTGQYEGVTGTGSFKESEEPWDGASLFEGSFELTLP